MLANAGLFVSSPRHPAQQQPAVTETNLYASRLGGLAEVLRHPAAAVQVVVHIFLGRCGLRPPLLPVVGLLGWVHIDAGLLRPLQGRRGAKHCNSQQQPGGTHTHTCVDTHTQTHVLHFVR